MQPSNIVQSCKCYIKISNASNKIKKHIMGNRTSRQVYCICTYTILTHQTFFCSVCCYGAICQTLPFQIQFHMQNSLHSQNISVHTGLYESELQKGLYENPKIYTLIYNLQSILHNDNVIIYIVLILVGRSKMICECTKLMMNKLWCIARILT